jgi:hypothetical protein
MGIENEPRLEQAKEADEREPQQTAPDTSPIDKETQEEPPPPVGSKPEPETEPTEVPVAFESLSQLVGKNILFRDPEVTGASDDPPYKHGTISKKGDQFVIEVERARYYPYYTGWDRSNIFALYSQADIDRLRVELEK